MNKKPLKIYIAGPYSAETEKQRIRNVNVAIDAAIAIFLKGHFPYVPHLTHYVDERTKKNGHELKWEDYIRWDMPWLDACDALLYLNNSKGANIELQAAQKRGIKIFSSVEEIPIVEEKMIKKNKIRSLLKYFTFQKKTDKSHATDKIT